ncbi:hypothetical protein [Psychrobacter urativorans]|uniref:hypothetical protein n=1 Tax=Psychrobacter urativorans TaxID=45610 RepID=UPI001D0FF08F|nr:hypothetical protein [Psychrobacter urativorans]
MMRPIYEQTIIPLHVRRLMIFNEICRKAKNKPNKVVHLSQHTKLAFGVMYLQDCRKYIAYGGMFEYAHIRREVIEQGVHRLPHYEYVMCAITVRRQAFTKPVRTPIALLWQWQNYVKNRRYTCLDDDAQHFFPINDELEMDYPPHRYHERLVATKCLPLWDEQKILTTPAYFDTKGRLRPKGYPEKRLV